jgi:hypothetical protein
MLLISDVINYDWLLIIDVINSRYVIKYRYVIN